MIALTVAMAEERDIFLARREKDEKRLRVVRTPSTDLESRVQERCYSVFIAILLTFFTGAQAHAFADYFLEPQPRTKGSELVAFPVEKVRSLITELGDSNSEKDPRWGFQNVILGCVVAILPSVSQHDTVCQKATTGRECIAVIPSHPKSLSLLP